MLELAVAEPADAAPARRRAADAAAPLTGAELFDTLCEDDFAGFGSAFTRIELVPGEILWRQATAHDGLYVLLEGEVQVCRRLPGERELELARLGPGEVMGELPLLGGGLHTATVRALGPCSLLFLSREEFEARAIAGEPSALELRRRIVAVACARLRRAHAALAETLGGAPASSVPAGGEQQRQPLRVPLPPRPYLARLALFRRLQPDLVERLLAGATPLLVERGHVLQREGTPSEHCHVVVKGAVEDVLRRGTSRLRIGFGGPGHAVGYLGLLDGGPASVSSLTRERSVLLAIDRALFATLYGGSRARSRGFAAAIEADLISSLEIATRSLSHVATNVSA